MGLNISLRCECCNCEVFEKNITHNLNKMADEAGIYKVLWRPEEIDCVYANDIIETLEKGLHQLEANPKYFKTFNASNGWGLYEHFVPFVKEVLEACKKFPKAKIETFR